MNKDTVHLSKFLSSFPQFVIFQLTKKLSLNLFIKSNSQGKFLAFTAFFSNKPLMLQKKVLLVVHS